MDHLQTKAARQTVMIIFELLFYGNPFSPLILPSFPVAGALNHPNGTMFQPAYVSVRLFLFTLCADSFLF